MPEPQVTMKLDPRNVTGNVAHPTDYYLIYLDDEIVWQTTDAREAAMFYAELKGRLKLAERGGTHA